MKTYRKGASRRAFLASHLHGVSTMGILEIGALNSPTFSEKEVDIKFADWFNYEQLAANYPHKKGIRPIDFVIDRLDFRRNFSTRFELIIANHVIEHIPDVVSWLQELAAIAEKGGHLFLAVPDRRYTFDIVRQETTLADLLDCYVRKLDKPDFRQVFSHLYYHKKVVASDVWENNALPQLHYKRFSADVAMRKAVEMSKGYHSLHCNVFTRDSFESVFQELREARVVAWSVAAIEDPELFSNEFLVLLRKADQD